MLLMVAVTASAQTVAQELQADPNRSAGNFYALPIDKMPKDTPAPEGKKPFYINHYGCPGSYYRESISLYEEPYQVFAKADSLGKLTKLGKDVKLRLDLLRRDAKDRIGELTSKGAHQSREQIRQMVLRFPDVFSSDGYYSGRSIVQNNCLLTVEEAMVQLSSMIQPLNMNLSCTHREDRFMEPQDKVLEALRWDSLTQVRYDRFLALHSGHARLMESLFTDQDFLISHVDPETLSRQLFVLAGSIQHTDLAAHVSLFDLFTPAEIRGHWKKLNAKYYITNGACTLNGSTQPFMQRATLRNMIHMGDSVQKREHPMAHLRFTNENVVIDEEQKSIIVTLPHAKLLSINMPPAETKLVYEQIPTFRDGFTAAESNGLLKQGEEAILNQVEDLGILAEAERNAKDFFRAMLAQMGFQSITIKFE